MIHWIIPNIIGCTGTGVEPKVRIFSTVHHCQVQCAMGTIFAKLRTNSNFDLFSTRSTKKGVSESQTDTYYIALKRVVFEPIKGILKKYTLNFRSTL